MPSTAEFAAAAALVGDPARAAMLTVLMDGRALSATELARAAGIAPQTASGHLTRLAEAGMLAMARQGRHHYYRLASAEIARMLEGIMTIAATSDKSRTHARPITTGPRDATLRYARTCYDHLAGTVAVSITDRMIARGEIELDDDGGALTESGAARLEGLGVDLQTARKSATRRGGGRIFCQPCLDWSERRPHVAGAVGTAMCCAWFRAGWIRRVEGSRAVRLTRPGMAELGRAFDLDLTHAEETHKFSV